MYYDEDRTYTYVDLVLEYSQPHNTSRAVLTWLRFRIPRLCQSNKLLGGEASRSHI